MPQSESRLFENLSVYLEEHLYVVLYTQIFIFAAVAIVLARELHEIAWHWKKICFFISDRAESIKKAGEILTL